VVLWKQSIDVERVSGKRVARSTGDKAAFGVLELKPFASGKSNSCGSILVLSTSPSHIAFFFSKKRLWYIVVV
jgi:hypothetical protein